ncbi:MAG: AMP-binding protein, partial [Chloroflexi bacterium]|nr:AMP-binding protein [Chloroflexota bacterium]
MDYPVIHKPALEEMKVKPNIQDYHESQRDFSWDRLKKELDGLEGGGLNLAYEAIDRHVKKGKGEKVAFYWEGAKGEEEVYTFAQFKVQSDKFANVLQGLGVEKGDRVFIYMDRIPELYFAFFGILKAGAIAGPLFSAFGPDPVRDRLLDSGAKVLVTSPNLRAKISGILGDLPDLKHVIVVNKNNRHPEGLQPGDVSYEEAMAGASEEFTIVRTTEEDYDIMHYTSGTTGKPKGAAHVHRAIYQQYATGKWVLDLHEDDIYWCTADPGWVTGTSYGMVAP